jgi:hypothetical protein
MTASRAGSGRDLGATEKIDVGVNAAFRFEPGSLGRSYSGMFEPRQKFWGCLAYRPRWGLSLRGYIVGALLFCAVTATFAFGVYPFLSITDRVPTRLLVMEGWIDPDAIKLTAREFNAHGYERVFTTGGPLAGMKHSTDERDTSAYVGANRLRAAGVADERVHVVPSFFTNRDRTFHSAIALRDWLKSHDVSVSAINIATADVHARRTRLLYQKALGPGVKVGIVAIPNSDYDARQWWRYSQGVRAVIGESIAYVYAALFFREKS